MSLGTDAVLYHIVLFLTHKRQRSPVIFNLNGGRKASLLPSIQTKAT